MAELGFELKPAWLSHFVPVPSFLHSWCPCTHGFKHALIGYVGYLRSHSELLMNIQISSGDMMSSTQGLHSARVLCFNCDFWWLLCVFSMAAGMSMVPMAQEQ